MSERELVLVTGASGYIAKHIILQLLEAGYGVRGSVRGMARGDEVRAAIKAHLKAHLHANVDLDEVLSFVKLDLNEDAGWDAAMEGVDVLMHTASPFPLAQPQDENELIRPAVEGALRALRAANKAGITRAVMTSSVAAIMYGEAPVGRDKMDERDWTNINHKTATPYVKSKTLAEQAAWEYVKGDEAAIELTVINPGFVLGPPLDEHFGVSLSVIQRLLRRQDPAVPAIGFVTVDVRDVARMHVEAIKTEASFGKRYIGVDRFVWFADIVAMMAKKFPDSRIITRKAPNWLVRILALFDADLRSVVASLGKKMDVDNSAARRDLGMDFIDVETCVIDSARYLIDHDLV